MSTKIEVYWDTSEADAEGWSYRLIDYYDGRVENGPVSSAADDAEARSLVTTVADDCGVDDAEITVFSSKTERPMYRATVKGGEVADWRWLK
jgi:hypothetical protein